MSLPRIQAYPMPTAGEQPAGRVDWRLAPERAALLVHDMQRYFLAPFRSGEEPVRSLVGNVAALVASCRSAGVPVFYTAQPGRQSDHDRGLLTEFWGAGIGAVIDSDPCAEEIVAEVAPAPGDVLLTKWRYSAFQRSTFAEQLAALGRDQLMITGVYAHIGCQATAVEAFMRDVRPFLVTDAVADFSRRHHDQAMEYVAQRCGVLVRTAEALDVIGAASAAATRTPVG